MITNKLRFVDDESTEDLAARKKRLRAYMKARRADNENRDLKEMLLTENAFEVLERLPEDTPKTAFVYLSFSSEAPTDKLIESLMQAGWRVYSPRIENKEMKAVLLSEDCSLSSYGIREPNGETYEEDVSVAFVPCLAVDEKGCRLGYGGGYYDKYLRQHPKTKRIAYGFDFQILKEVPCEPFDEKMDEIVTDKRCITLASRNEDK